MTPHGRVLEEWTKNLDWETEAKPLWQKTSKDFAGSTVGDAHVFMSPNTEELTAFGNKMSCLF